MDVINEYQRLIGSDIFREFISSHSGFYMVHIYTMFGKNENEEKGLEFGFYNEEKDKIVVFETNPIKKRDEEEAFKEGKTIALLDLSRVRISFDDALDIAEKTRQAKYPSEIIYKKIIILQNIESQVWNITLISMAFNIINIKIDAESGEVLGTNIHSIMNLGTKI